MPSSTFPCVIIALIVLALWSVLADKITVPTMLAGLLVALAAAVWSPLVEG